MIGRLLNKRGLLARKLNRRFHISAKNLFDRFVWAQSLIDMDGEEWRNIVFSDECKLRPQKSVY